MNVKWPQTPENGLRPWYLIVWATPWYILFRIAAIIIWISVFMMAGFDAANEMYEEII